MDHQHPHPYRESPRLSRGVAALGRRVAALARVGRHQAADRLPPLPVHLRRGRLPQRYLVAAEAADHRRAAAAARVASGQAVARGEWRAAELWAFRSLWHCEQGKLWLHAVRAARRIAEVRSAAGNPGGARRYYTEAISEARDLGAEREEGLAAVGLGRAEIELGNVTTGRRLAQIGIDLLERCGAPGSEIAAAREVRGVEKPVGGMS